MLVHPPHYFRQDIRGLISEASTRRGLQFHRFGESDAWLRWSGFVSADGCSWHHRRQTYIQAAL